MNLLIFSDQNEISPSDLLFLDHKERLSPFTKGALIFLSSAGCLKSKQKAMKTLFVRNRSLPKTIAIHRHTSLGVSLATGLHLIPSRTQKLSPSTANLVQRKLCAKIARCPHYFKQKASTLRKSLTDLEWGLFCF